MTNTPQDQDGYISIASLLERNVEPESVEDDDCKDKDLPLDKTPNRIKDIINLLEKL